MNLVGHMVKLVNVDDEIEHDLKLENKNVKSLNIPI